MSGNSAFELVGERGWQRGLGNLLNSEFAHWWKTRMWWIQCLIWVGIVGFMMGAIMFSSEGNLETGVMIYCIFASLGPAVAVIIVMQDAVVGEKQSGTAAWVLSKPVSRPAFILSKLLANSLGVLVTMVLVPGILAYALISIATRTPLNIISFLGAMLVIWLSLLFYLTFTLMLGTFFNGRGPVIGLGMGLIFLQQYLVGLLPPLGYVLPWTLSVPLNNQTDAIVPKLLQGIPLDTAAYTHLALTLLISAVMVLVALWRFEKEEF